MDDARLVFTPPPTLDAFMSSDKLVRFLMGPVGSGKTTACIYELLRRAAEQQPGPDGYRHTRFALVRNTLQQIKTTILKDIQQILTPIIHYKVSESTIYVTAGDIRSEWLMIPLDTIEDQRRLLSTQLTMAWVNEWREVNPDLVTALIGRLGRYPSPMVGGPTFHGLIADSNPGTMDSPWFEKLELNLPSKWSLFRQPGGLSDEAENIENLPTDYYENVMDGADPDWIDGHVYGLWMPSLVGTAVFRSSFAPDEHVAEERIEAAPGHALCVGMDLGRTPCALITQINWEGTLCIIKEVTGKDTDLEQFLEQQLIPVLHEEQFNRCPVYIVFDPSGTAKGQYTRHSALDIYKSAKLPAVPAPTNAIKPRLAAVNQYLLRRKGLKIDGTQCPMLVQSLKFQYKYKRKKDGELEDKPEKLHPWSDLADALQYAALGLNSRIQARAVRLVQRQSQQSAQQVTAEGWT